VAPGSGGQQWCERLLLRVLLRLQLLRGCGEAGCWLR
jgi:hypothetical protein